MKLEYSTEAIKKLHEQIALREPVRMIINLNQLSQPTYDTNWVEKNVHVGTWRNKKWGKMYVVARADSLADVPDAIWFSGRWYMDGMIVAKGEDCNKENSLFSSRMLGWHTKYSAMKKMENIIPLTLDALETLMKEGPLGLLKYQQENPSEFEPDFAEY